MVAALLYKRPRLHWNLASVVPFRFRPVPRGPTPLLMIKEPPGDHHLAALTVKVFDPEGAYSAFDSRLTQRNLINLFANNWIGYLMPLRLHV